VSKFTRRIDQTLEHIQNKSDWEIAKLPEWVLQVKLLEQPWYTHVMKRYCVACGVKFGGGEAWSVLVNTKKLGADKEEPVTASVNVCSHCAPSRSLLASRLREPRTKKNILSIL
jgi:hypothetical protein